VLPLDHRELVHDEPIIRQRQIEIQQTHPVTGNGSIQPRVFHFHAIPQHPVKHAVRLHQRRHRHPQHFPQCLLPRVLGDSRIQAPDRLAQAFYQHHRAKRIPFRRRFTGRNLRPVPDRIAQLPEPFEGRVFDDGFVEAHGLRLNKQLIVFQ
jgi:hypothetical protein